MVLSKDILQHSLEALHFIFVSMFLITASGGILGIHASVYNKGISRVYIYVGSYDESLGNQEKLPLEDWFFLLGWHSSEDGSFG